MDFTGKTVLITGASRGIGRATAIAFARLGAAVGVNYVRGADAAEEVVSQIRAAGGRGVAIQADVAVNSEAAALIERVADEFGSLDVLVNNAGITRDGLIIRMSPDDWQQVIQTNLGGAFNCTQAAAKKMIRARKGAIVNVSSVVGIIGNAGQANYTAAKAGLIGLTKSTARELASRNVRVNAVAPGFIATEMTEALSEAQQQSIAERIPLARFGSSEDVAGAIAWLASDEAAYVTGQTLVVDGGLAM